MIHNAIKEYLHQATITPTEVDLIKELLKDGKETLKDFLPKDKKSYFLPRLLEASLVNYKDNKDFIDDIIALRSAENKDSIHYKLKNHKYGLELIKNNPTLFSNDFNEAFEDLLNKGASKPLAEFVKNNQANIDINNIYKHNLDISAVQALEKVGVTFDERIIDVVVNEKNYRKSDKLLNYISKFESTCDEKIWNNSIIRMLCYYNRQHWDDYGKYKFIDSFSLVTKLKNPSQYKWGQEINSWNYFHFPDSLRAFVNNRGFSGYLDDKNPGDLNKVREFIKNNDIYLGSLKSNFMVFSVFIDDLSDAVFNKTLKDNWSELFDFKEMEEIRINRNRGFHRDTAIFDDLRKENSVLQNERFRKFVLKEYFSNKKYRLKDYNEGTFFSALGLGKDDILYNSALSKYSDILDKNIEYILDKSYLNKKEREVALMNYEMRKPDDFTNPKDKKFKL